MEPLVTIITPTTGNKQLYQAVLSVEQQTYKNIQHLVVIDGPDGARSAHSILEGSQADIIELPYATGKDQYNGHRIYGAMTFVAKGDYIVFLDEDNWFEPNHIESLVEQIKSGNKWAYALRKIVSQDGEYICNDDCESLGKWTSIINDKFIDLNCFMISKAIALQFAPYWYRRARHPDDQPEVDRLLSYFLMGNTSMSSGVKFDTNGLYTVNYRVAARADSVQDVFFIKGNEAMKLKMNGEYPWRKKT
jgi:glycosyltransferase involved in cell wall biosynthesis